MTPDEIIAVVSAFKEGKAIQCKYKGSLENYYWVDIENPNWNFEQCDYRVKPEPFECWVILDATGDYYKHLKSPPPETAVLHYRELKYTIHHMREVL